MIVALQRVARGGLWAMPWIVALPIAMHWAVGPHPQPAWRGQYFDNTELRGTPKHVARTTHLDFRWKDAPHTSIPADNFSVRWDACLPIDHAANVALQLIADDRARLYIDGKVVFDQWLPRKIRSVGSDIALTPGLHHLRLEYAELAGHARVALAASFHNEVPHALGSEHLLPIGPDPKNPCRAHP